MRIVDGPTVPREMLDGRERSAGTGPVDPGGHQLRDPVGGRSERTSLHDRVGRFEIEIGHRRQHPVDPDRAGGPSGDQSGLADGPEVVQGRERGGRRQLGQALDLLTRTPLEIRRNQQRTTGQPGHPVDQRKHLRRCTSENDETTDARRNRAIDGCVLVLEAGILVPANGWYHQSRGFHAGVTIPRTRDPRAPVARGRLPG